jgi:2-haloacid dehalogenase
MATTRRRFVGMVGAAAIAGAAPADAKAGAQSPGRPSPLTALAFDAYGTLFDVFSVTALCEELFPGKGSALAQLWRAKQLQYSLLRSLMRRYQNFWSLTEDGLVYASNSLGLELTTDKRRRLMEAYLTLTAFADVRPGLDALKRNGLRLAILSNGEPKMLKVAATNAGIAELLDAVISVEEVKVFNPSPQVYSLISRHLGTDRRSVGFVSSNSWDVAGAASAGLRTFWIQRTAAEPPEELGFPASHTVRAITDLPALVGR